MRRKQSENGRRAVVSRFFRSTSEKTFFQITARIPDDSQGVSAGGSHN